MISIRDLSIQSEGIDTSVSLTTVHTLVLGSGAAGLNAAAQLKLNQVDDVMIVTEGLKMGTSINTGSDKQTYYKLSMSGDEGDSPLDMARSYYDNGGMHGDLALVEASLSARAFINLVNLGVPFPRDEFGQFVGYKTDHDPRQRATSIGPYTSREMCRVLIEQVQHLGIPIREGRNAIELITLDDEGGKRVCGLLAVTEEGKLEAYLCENLIFAVGGPGGLYENSVYPSVHNGAIGLALMAGAEAAGLPESQYGLASIKFRWNVSGTYMQVIPRFISRDADGLSDEREFLRPYFTSDGELYGKVFLKGYQWPFDARKVPDGSSIIDILVYIEAVLNHRRVFLDFRSNSQGFAFDALPDEARTYLERSGASQETPIARLETMNPQAIQLYQAHDINLHQEPLEIGVCAQHNNGGLAGTIWYELTNIRHLFPIGEVNGSHGVARPGGSALNAGQVAGFRAAELVANRYRDWYLDCTAGQDQIITAVTRTLRWLNQCKDLPVDWRDAQEALRQRMTTFGAHIRSQDGIELAVCDAQEQVAEIGQMGCQFDGEKEISDALRVRQLCVAQLVYLEAIRYQIRSGVGSRGSSIVMDPTGIAVHPKLSDEWRITPEAPQFREKVLKTIFHENGSVINRWEDCRPLPEFDSWFETVWARFRSGGIYQQE